MDAFRAEKGSINSLVRAVVKEEKIERIDANEHILKIIIKKIEKTKKFLFLEIKIVKTGLDEF